MDAAIDYAQRAWLICRRLLGPDHHRTVLAQSQLGLLLFGWRPQPPPPQPDAHSASSSDASLQQQQQQQQQQLAECQSLAQRHMGRAFAALHSCMGGAAHPFAGSLAAAIAQAHNEGGHAQRAVGAYDALIAAISGAAGAGKSLGSALASSASASVSSIVAAVTAVEAPLHSAIPAVALAARHAIASAHRAACEVLARASDFAGAADRADAAVAWLNALPAAAAVEFAAGTSASQVGPTSGLKKLERLGADYRSIARLMRIQVEAPAAAANANASASASASSSSSAALTNAKGGDARLNSLLRALIGPNAASASASTSTDPSSSASSASSAQGSSTSSSPSASGHASVSLAAYRPYEIEDIDDLAALPAALPTIASSSSSTSTRGRAPTEAEARAAAVHELLAADDAAAKSRRKKAGKGKK